MSLAWGRAVENGTAQMAICEAVGTHYRRGEAAPDPVTADQRQPGAGAFDPEGPDRLWCMQITEHRIGTCRSVHLAASLR